ncbi:MAG: nucleotidyltransferase family protein [Candidatus Omnitrophota bacterium]
MSKKEIIKIIKDNNYIFSKYTIKKFAIFGSCVRGQLKKDSDIDIIVKFEKPTFKNFIYLARELEKMLGRKVDLLTFSSLDKFLKPYILKEAEYIEGK